MFDSTRPTEAFERIEASPAFEAVLAFASRSGQQFLWRRSGATCTRLSLNHQVRQMKRAHDIPFRFENPCFAELREMTGIGKVVRVSFPWSVHKPANPSHPGPTSRKNPSRDCNEILVLRCRRGCDGEEFYLRGIHRFVLRSVPPLSSKTGSRSTTNKCKIAS